MSETWTRIPAPIPSDSDRRKLCAILSAHGLEVRVIRHRATPKGTYQKYIEYRSQEITP